MKERNEYFDFLKGIAIMMVVAIHTLPHVSGYNSIYQDMIIAVRQLMNCAVPLFLAVSGYFLSKKYLDTKREVYSFWKKQIPRVYLPMVIWGLGWLLLSIPKINGPEAMLLRAAQLLTGGFSVYYFVVLIIQCYLLLPILKKWKWGG